jgi:hypothetical protein
MTSESKILTVSYGTFSCTLEGFDNPFDTMKEIAEYFRDLAAQDRHFGAEPPAPDAAVLHRMAEREVARLSTATQSDEATTPSDAPAAAPVTPRIRLNPVARGSSRSPVDTETADSEDLSAPEPSLQDVIPDGVAAKLARIRRSVQPAAADLAAAAAFSPEPLVTALDLSEDATSAPVEEEAAAFEDSLAEAADDAAPGDAAARLGELIADGEESVDAEILTEGFSDAAEDVAQPDVDPANFWTDTAAEMVEHAAEPESVDLAEADGIEDEPMEPVETSLTDDLVDVQDEAAEDLAALAQLDGIEFDEDSLAAALEDPLPEETPAEFSLSEAEAVDPLPDSEPALETETAAETAAELAQEPTADAADSEADVDDMPEVTTRKQSGRSRRVNSRVVRIHPSEDPTRAGSARDGSTTRVLSRSQDDSDEISRLMQQAEEVMAEDENRRRQEALSRLKAAVASTEADRADIDYEAPRADENLDPYRGDLADAIQPDQPEEPAAPPEVKPRRKSVQIRAQEPRPGTIRPGMISPPPLVLVSEQRIDRVAPPASAPASAPSKSPEQPGISPSIPDGQPMVALRTGRLSGAIGAGAALATSAAPARNLVLEKPSYGTQVETDDDEDLAEDTREIDESGLAAFADIVGAKSMAEMLEAAAAYATCVESRTQFTRPQLMRRMMASAGGKPVSREDGLRSFGTLLRTGRIEKVTRGHYSLAENSPYLAEARRLT